MVSFKDRFKELRKEKGLTLREIGMILNLTESNLSLYESGKRQPKAAEDFIKIADFYNVSVDFLMGRTDNRKMNKVRNKAGEKAIETEVTYPDGLTYERVIKILKCLKEAGVDLNPNK